MKRRATEIPRKNPILAPTPAPGLRPFLPVLLVLFVGSGCSALIYEIVWYQLLQLIIGSTTVSLAVLLATFMGGLCLGSLTLPRLRVAQRYHPLLVYAVLEAGIGLCGLLALFGMPLIDGVYAVAVGHGFPAMFLRAMVCAACLLPPTALMGASLPAASRWLETSPEGVSWLGLFYGGNTAGAVFGCLLAGFYLLRVHDMATATLVAAAINAVVATISWRLAKRTPYEAKEETPAREPCRERHGQCTRPSRCRACARWARRSCGRDCWGCCLARQSIHSRSFWPSSWSAWLSAAAPERCGRRAW